jgi:hypothetical protein
MDSDCNLFIKNKIENIINNIKSSINELNFKNMQNEINHHILLEYYNLITNNISDQNTIIYFLHIISREINKSVSLIEKQLLLSLLPEFFIPFFTTNIKLTYPYLSRILTCIQSNIVSDIPPAYFGTIFKKIIFYLFNDIDGQNKEPINKDIFEKCQGFCFYNMKIKGINNQSVGIICLNILLNEINYSFLNENNFVIYIWGKLSIYMNSSSFFPKNNLLKYLYDFITKFKDAFKPFVNIAIYKILEFIDNNDTVIRKTSLNILGLLISFYPNEIEPIKNSILQLLLILHNDSDGNIRSKSIYIYNKLKRLYFVSHSINPSRRKNHNLYFYNYGYDNRLNKRVSNSISNITNICHRRALSKNQTNASFSLFHDSNIRKTLDTEPINSKSEINDTSKFSVKNKAEKSNYININRINPNKLDDNKNIGLGELINMVKRKSDNKCRIDDNFSNLINNVKKNNDNILKIRKSKIKEC